ncbi:MAG: hypothetical protein LEGION0403_FIIPPAGN_00746 [Legionella sp.]
MGFSGISPLSLLLILIIIIALFGTSKLKSHAAVSIWSQRHISCALVL